MMVMATLTARDAVVAEDAVAARAVVIALAADGCFALLAGPRVVAADVGSAVGALGAVPFRQRDEGTARVVSAEQIGDDRKEVV